MALQRSVRRTIRESRDHSGDKITIESVSPGKDGAFKDVKQHFIYGKHRGSAIKEEFFGSLEAAENKLLEKKGKGEGVVCF